MDTGGEKQVQQVIKRQSESETEITEPTSVDREGLFYLPSTALERK